MYLFTTHSNVRLHTSLKPPRVFLPLFPRSQSSLPRTRSNELAHVSVLISRCGLIPSWHASRSPWVCCYVHQQGYATVVPKLCCAKPKTAAGYAWTPSLATKFNVIKLYYRSFMQVSDDGIISKTNELLGFVISCSKVQKCDSSFWNIFPLFLFESFSVHLKEQTKFRET